MARLVPAVGSTAVLCAALTLCLAVGCRAAAPSPAVAHYWEERGELLSEQRGQRFDTAMRANMTPAESRANATLVGLRDALRANISRFAATPIRAVKGLVQDTHLFTLLHTMPKGATLHVHSPALASVSWLISNITTRPNCYIYWRTSYEAESRHPLASDTPKGAVSFFPDVPSLVPQGYITVAELQRTYPNATVADILTPYWDTLHNETVIDEVNDPWGPFQRYFTLLGGALRYLPVLRDYLRSGLSNAVLTWKVNYVELRALGLGFNAYRLDGNTTTTLSSEDTVLEYAEAAESVKALLPGKFLGATVIYSQYRKVDSDVVRQSLEEAVSLKAKFPGFIVGYDLVGQEDAGNPLSQFVPELLEYSDVIDYYFHAGETDWTGNLTTGQNAVDAVLLKTKRIGHGLALGKLPGAVEAVVAQGIAVEVCPISNQGLQFVLDARQHPASVLLSRGVPLVLSNDDPTILTTTGTMAWDFIIAFLSWDMDMASLKQLAVNSIQHSALGSGAKAELYQVWAAEWEAWVNSVAAL